MEKNIKSELDLLTQQFNDFLDLAGIKESQVQAAIEAIVLGDTDTLKTLLKDHSNLKTQIRMVIEGKSISLGEISHELRTPLNRIIGFSELIEENRPLARNKDIVARVL